MKYFDLQLLKIITQVFARDVAFVIEEKNDSSQTLSKTEKMNKKPTENFREKKVEWRKIINLPETAHIEGGDVIVWNDFLFIGTCYSEDYRSFKTARTNEYAIEILKEYFPKKES